MTILVRALLDPDAVTALEWGGGGGHGTGTVRRLGDCQDVRVQGVLAG